MHNRRAIAQHSRSKAGGVVRQLAGGRRLMIAYCLRNRSTIVLRAAQHHCADGQQVVRRSCGTAAPIDRRSGAAVRARSRIIAQPSTASIVRRRAPSLAHACAATSGGGGAVNCGSLRQSGPRPDPRLLRQAALEALTRSARTDSPRKTRPERFPAKLAAAAGGARRRRDQEREAAAFGIQLAVGPQPLWLRNHNSGPAQRIMVKRLATSPHDPLGITDSACKNQSVVVSVQYGPFNPYIPIRSTTIGKSRVARDPIAMHTSWRSNSDITSVTSYASAPPRVALLREYISSTSSALKPSSALATPRVALLRERISPTSSSLKAQFLTSTSSGGIPT
ncbi:hypothetical protein F511_25563 [Dorcoceras hygrometricum]|uniref:Uncharacterized protein n=1 Tax=Dorcoceras hygrometricum TaxID=472368 RepID=A0A2Z7D112_9LAMI|nr:hypothetical protein F511_25563 [Dorcoceras hygrometricum]